LAEFWESFSDRGGENDRGHATLAGTNFTRLDNNRILSLARPSEFFLDFTRRQAAALDPIKRCVTNEKKGRSTNGPSRTGVE